ncbi:hypothetical protein RAS1_20460 [Phycisphaerae bacterium RAS1]|nr:hypothetical protein RAS1_20460 [Phycisphaerae bacterium RAS1]
MRWFRITLVAAIILISGVIAFELTANRIEQVRLRAQLAEVEEDRRRLIEFAERLSASRRVAQIDVLSQRRDDAGRLVSSLLWQELAADGTVGRPLTFETLGEQVYVEALVIKFEHHFVGQADPQRGRSLAMFRRVFGDQQMSAAVPEIDRGERPSVDLPLGADALHDRLWELFWRLVDDSALAKHYGVRVAQCEAPSVPMHAGDLWEVSLDAAGGLNLRKLIAGISPSSAPGP